MYFSFLYLVHESPAFTIYYYYYLLHVFIQTCIFIGFLGNAYLSFDSLLRYYSSSSSDTLVLLHATRSFTLHCILYFESEKSVSMYFLLQVLCMLIKLAVFCSSICHLFLLILKHIESFSCRFKYYSLQILLLISSIFAFFFLSYMPPVVCIYTHVYMVPNFYSSFVFHTYCFCFLFCL